MSRRLLIALALVAALAAPAPRAHANTPSVLAGAPATTADRFQPSVTFTYTGVVSVSDPATQVTFHRAGSATSVPFTVSGSGTTAITVSATGTLASGTTYIASLLPDGDLNPDSVQWKTRSAPDHPSLHVKIVTALAPDAVDDIARRLDRANLLAVPKAADFVDISMPAAHSLTAGNLKGYQAALVVTDQDVYDRTAAASALAAFAQAGHGVVLGGQTHWTTGGPWTALSAIGGPSSSWATNWSPLGYVDPPAIEGGSLKTASIQTHFLTRFLTSFHVLGAGSGRESTQNGWNEAVLARLQPTAAYSYGQSLLSIHWESPAQKGRVVDLGFNPWSNDEAGGGYDPAATPQAAPLIARALWWACDRIAPTHTHFTSKPKSPTMFRTVTFSLAARDADPGSSFSGLRYQYRLGNGRWKFARGGTTFVLYHLPAGHTYTVRARAVDFAGNKDAHSAVYRFRVPAGAYG